MKFSALKDFGRDATKTTWLLLSLIGSSAAFCSLSLSADSPPITAAKTQGAVIGKQATSEHFSTVTMLSLEVSSNGSNTLINLAQSGDINSSSAVLFIHGSPGDWTAFSEYMQDSDLTQRNLMLSYDRPGWGQSTLNTDLIGQFEPQASAALEIMQNYPDKHWTIVGHSLGASIAPTIMLNATAAGYSVNAIVLLAGTLNPQLGKPRWFNRLAKLGLVNMIIGNQLRRSNTEILRLHEELTLQDIRLKRSREGSRETTSLIVIQGARDKLVSAKNADYVRAHWTGIFNQLTVEVIEDEGHFLPWRQASLIKKHILQSLSQ